MEIKSRDILRVFNMLQTSGTMKKLPQRDQAMLHIAANEAVLIQLQEQRGDAVEIIDRPNWIEVMHLEEAKSIDEEREDEDDAELQARARNIFDDNRSVLRNVLTHQPEEELEGTFGPLTEWNAFYAEELLCEEAESMIEHNRDYAANWATAEQLDQAWADYESIKAEHAELLSSHEVWRRALAAKMRVYSE